jgi:hypothetical protein
VEYADYFYWYDTTCRASCASLVEQQHVVFTPQHLHHCIYSFNDCMATKETKLYDSARIQYSELCQPIHVGDWCVGRLLVDLYDDEYKQ